jgi:hypothetical protein
MKRRVASVTHGGGIILEALTSEKLRALRGSSSSVAVYASALTLVQTFYGFRTDLLQMP